MTSRISSSSKRPGIQSVSDVPCLNPMLIDFAIQSLGGTADLQAIYRRFAAENRDVTGKYKDEASLEATIRNTVKVTVRSLRLSERVGRLWPDFAQCSGGLAFRACANGWYLRIRIELKPGEE